MSLRTILAAAAGALLLLPFLALPACDDEPEPVGTFPPWTDYVSMVTVETSLGDIVIELYPDRAPVTVENFRRYAVEGFYDGLIFHRVIAGFVIQGGAYTDAFEERETRDPIPSEAGNGLGNLRGTIAMVRSSRPHSATSQFFINLRDNTFLDHYDDTDAGYGYAVFGRVIAGMDVVDAIAALDTQPKDGFNDVPVTPVYMRMHVNRWPGEAARAR